MSRTNEKAAGRALKRQVLDLLNADDFEASLRQLRGLPGRQVINPLFSLLMHPDEQVRGRAVTAMGAVVAHLASTDPDGARVIMRRLMWSLNDESGGIGWGAPEAMAEIMAQSEILLSEYLPVFLSYLDEQGNFLEYEVLQRGLLWGLARLARNRPEEVRRAANHLGKYLESSDPSVRGNAAWCVGLLRARELRAELQALLEDPAEMHSCISDAPERCRVGDVAREALNLLDRQNG